MASTPGFTFDVERLIDDEYFIRVGEGEQVRWELWEQPRVLPGVELHDVFRSGSAADREVSDASAVGSSYALSVEKHGKIRTVFRPYDECSEPVHGLTSKDDLHLRRVGPVNPLEVSQPKDLRQRWGFVPVRAVVIDPQSLPGIPVDMGPYQPVRITLSHQISINEDVDPGEPDAGIGFDDENDGE